MLASEQKQAELEAIAWHERRGELSYSGTHDTSHVLFQPRDRGGYYYGSTFIKKRIVLHFTVGYLGGDLSTLTQDDYHVSVPYVISRGGSVFEIHDPSFWSYHLGSNAVGGNKLGSRESIGIELSNIGPLELAGNWLWDTNGQRYCRVEDHEYYWQLDQPYRGFLYFASFTADQYQSLRQLLTLLTVSFDIPWRFMDEPDRFDLFQSAEQAREYRSICSHVNFRGEREKWDIGPAFEWGRIAS